MNNEVNNFNQNNRIQNEDYLFSVIVGKNDNASCENMADRLINSLEIINMKDKNE